MSQEFTFMSKEEIWSSFLQVFSKTIVPSIITVVIGIAVEYRRTRKLSGIQIVTSFIIGVGTVYLLHDYIHDTWTGKMSTVMISVITAGSIKGWELLMTFINNTKLSDVIRWMDKFSK